MFEIGLLLVFVGFILIIFGFLLMPRRGGRGGGVILIGPFPIVWGTDKESVKWLFLISIIFIFFYLFLLLVYSGFRL